MNLLAAMNHNAFEVRHTATESRFIFIANNNELLSFSD